MLRYLLLAAVILWPSLGGMFPQLGKSLALALGCLLLIPRRDCLPLSRPTIWIALALLCGLVSSLPWGAEAMVGSPRRVEGWLTLACVAGFGFLGFWQSKRDPDTGEIEPDRDVSLYIAAAAALCIYAYTCWCWMDWTWMAANIGSRLGLGAIVCTLIPLFFTVALGIRRAVPYAAILIVCCLVMAVDAGCRSALLGAAVGCIVSTVMICRHASSKVRRQAITIGACVLLALVLAVAVHAPLRRRVTDVDWTNYGTGIRSQLVLQGASAGIPLFGWGCDVQKQFTDESRLVGAFDKTGIFDKLHCWPVDLLFQFGWIGGFCLAMAAGFIARIAWRNSQDWSICALSGSLAAFLATALFNPPCPQVMVLGAIAAGGICVHESLFVRSFSPSMPPPRVLPLMARITGAVGVVVFSLFLAGDQINFHADKEFCEHKGRVLPHRLLAQKWLASSVNPWLRGEYAWWYVEFAKKGHLIEPRGGKLFLMEQLRRDPRHPEIEALFWAGFGDQAKALQLAAQKRR